MGFHERYTEEEREALASAYTDRGIRPARRVVELAAAGELEHNGQRLPAFETNESTVRGLASDLGRRRAGQVVSQLATAPARDAVEALRRRLVNVADAGLGEMERRSRKAKGYVEWEQMRQAGRAIRELAALPGPSDPRPAAPGARVDGRRDGGTTEGGLAGELLAAARANPVTPPLAPDEPAPEADPEADAEAALIERMQASALARVAEQRAADNGA